MEIVDAEQRRDEERARRPTNCAMLTSFSATHHRKYCDEKNEHHYGTSQNQSGSRLNSNHPIQKKMNSKVSFLLITVLFCLVGPSLAFAPTKPTKVASMTKTSSSSLYIFNNKKKNSGSNEGGKKMISGSRRKKLGIAEDEDEYDLGMALDNNTDPFITKVIAGSFILAVIALLVAGIIIPATTDYGEGVCQPLLTGGRC
jgi:hypothetical protein